MRQSPPCCPDGQDTVMESECSLSCSQQLLTDSCTDHDKSVHTLPTYTFYHYPHLSLLCGHLCPSSSTKILYPLLTSPMGAEYPANHSFCNAPIIFSEIECRGRMVRNVVSYSGGPEFRPRPGYGLSWALPSFFSAPPSKCQDSLKLGHGQFHILSNTWFIIQTTSPEDGGNKFLQNFGIYLQVHTVLQPRRKTRTWLVFHVFKQGSGCELVANP